MSRITTFGRRWPTAVLLAIAAIAIGAIFGAARNGQAASTVVPSNTAPPTISGEIKVGSTLTTTNGTWSGTTPLTFTYQWQRCDENGASCAAISGATQNTYVLKQADGGSTLRVVVTATNADGKDTATSVPTAVVGTTQNTGCPSGTGTIQVADLSPPARLMIEQQVTNPSTITRSTSQLVAHSRITACGGRPVQGALVLVTVVPYDQFGGQEQPTGADGTVDITLNRQKGFPVSSKQQLLVMFIRARKSGEDVLAGVSNRRLVSFPVSAG
jgi:hypothetical protein